MTREDFIKRALPEVINNYGEKRYTSYNSIVFPNGLVASISNNGGITTHNPDGSIEENKKSPKKNSVAVCDYEGFFDWTLLNSYGAIDGCIYCDTEEEICKALSIIEKL